MPRVFGVVPLGLFMLCWPLEAQDAKPKHDTARPKLDTRKKQDTNKQKRDGTTKKPPLSNDVGHNADPGSPAVTVPPTIPKSQTDTETVYLAEKAERTVSIIELPHSLPPGDSLEFLWYFVLAFSVISILFLGYAYRRLAARRALTASLDPLASQVEAAVKQATAARSWYKDLGSRYEELAKRGPRAPPSPPPTPPAYSQTTRQTIKPTEPDISLVRPPALSYAPTSPVKPALPSSSGSSQFSRIRDEVVEAYHRARTSVGSSARDEFERLYPFERASCINHEDWRFDKNVVLRFQRDPFGWFLVVRRGTEHQAFPWFTQDLSKERESFGGVFQYPEAGGAAPLRVASPATLKSQGDDWIQTAPGSLQVDA